MTAGEWCDCGGIDAVPHTTDHARDCIHWGVATILDGISDVLKKFPTAQLEQIAAERTQIRPDGWLQTVIREYLDVWEV